MDATASRHARAAAAVLLLFASSVAAGGDTNGVYEPCADATVQRGDGFTFGVAFAGHDAFFSGGVQLSPCDGSLSLASKGAKLAVFRPKVDEISLLTVNTSGGGGFDPATSGGYMVAFAGRKYAARSSPVFVSNSSYTVTSFTLVFEFKKGTLQNLYWKANGCSACSGQPSFACVDQNCAISTTNCTGKSGRVDCSPGILRHRQARSRPQLMVRGVQAPAVLPSWALLQPQGLADQPVQHLLLASACSSSLSSSHFSSAILVYMSVRVKVITLSIIYSPVISVCKEKKRQIL